MKKTIIKTILGMVAMLSLFLACAEADSATGQLLWTGVCLCICGISAKGYERCMTKKEMEEEV